jgi:thiamine-phosphate pyrophosphorylase
MIKYLITDPKYYTNNPIIFKKTLEQSLINYSVDMVCFRDKISENFEDLAKICLEVCREKNIEKVLINSNIDLALKLKFDGVHLTSMQFEDVQKLNRLGLFTIISCHNKKELEKAQVLKIDMVTYSPIFYTPNKGKPKGTRNFKKVISKFSGLDIIALGGIVTNTHIKRLKKIQTKGFSSIRYFISVEP